MAAPPDYVEAESWDAIALAQAPDIGRTYTETSYRWQGTVPSSQIAGLTGSGKALRGVGNYSYKTPFSTFRTFCFRFLGRLFTGAATSQVFVKVGDATLQTNGSGAWQLVRTGVGTVYGTAGTGPTVNVIYNIEVEVYRGTSATGGQCRVTIDGAEVFNLTGLNMGGTGANDFIRDVDFANGNLDVDEGVLQAWVAGGVDPAHFLSDSQLNPHVATLRPDAQGTYNAFLRGTTTGTFNFEEIDEEINDGLTTYLYSPPTPANKKDSWSFTPAPSGMLQVFGLWLTISHDGGGATSPHTSFLRQGGGDFLDSYVGGGALNFFHRKRLWQNQANGAGPWDKPAIDAMEGGVNSHLAGIGQGYKVSQAYVQVLYSSAPPVTPSLSTPAAGLLQRATHHLCKCWKIKRLDGVIQTFTEHDTELVLEDGLTYSPAGGLTGSVIRKEVGLREQDADFVGAVTSDKITYEDLRRRKYDGAQVIEYVVDWRYPWMGSVHTSQYHVLDVERTDKAWRATVGGLAHRLGRKSGIITGRTCRHDLYGTGCNVDPTGFSISGETVITVVDRRTFLATGLVIGGQPDEYFANGELTWLTGANAGDVVRVYKYTQVNKRFELFLPTIKAIAAGDTFAAKAGCDKLRLGDCKTKFNNVINFGGEPFIPGRDRSLRGGLV